MTKCFVFVITRSLKHNHQSVKMFKKPLATSIRLIPHQIPLIIFIAEIVSRIANHLPKQAIHPTTGSPEPSMHRPKSGVIFCIRNCDDEGNLDRICMVCFPKVSYQDLDDSDKRCHICFEDFKDDSEVHVYCCPEELEDDDNPTKLGCGHLIGSDCLQKCIENKAECPMCRADFDKMIEGYTLAEIGISTIRNSKIKNVAVLRRRLQRQAAKYPEKKKLVADAIDWLDSIQSNTVTHPGLQGRHFQELLSDLDMLRPGTLTRSLSRRFEIRPAYEDGL